MIKDLNKEKLLQTIDINLENRKRINKLLESQFVDLLEARKFNFRCSDHAIVRYQERIEFVPPSEARYIMLTDVEDEILNKNIKVELLKDVHYRLPVRGKFYILKNGNIVTVFTAATK